MALVATPGLSSNTSHWGTLAKHFPGNCDGVPTTRVNCPLDVSNEEVTAHKEIICVLVK